MPVKPRGRLADVLDHIAAECEAVGLPFRRPRRISSTRLALEAAEIVRAARPESFPAVDTAFYEAQWVHGLDLGDPVVLRGILADLGLAVDLAGGAELLDEAMVEAREHDVTGTPAWWVDDRLLIPGVQDRDTVQRWVERLADSREVPEPPR
jgi:predicted DsbA family dithiol-disulfide isomerase